jgi:hypothetical protein
MRNAAVMALWFALVAGTVLGAHLVLDKPYRVLTDDKANALEFQLVEQERVVQALRDSIDAVRATCTAKCNLLRCVP